MSEKDERTPVEYYGRSKLEAEQAVEASKTNWTIIRPSGVYGPRDTEYFRVFKLAYKGWSPFYGNRDRFMSVVYIDDLVSSLVNAANSSESTGRGYFICDGEPVSWHRFQSCICDKAGKKPREINLPEFFVSVAAVGGELLSGVDGKPRLFNRQRAIMGKQDAWTCTHDAATQDFGFQPTVALGQGVGRTLDWYTQEGWL